MGQVAFDTQEFVETLENAGLPKDQARAISIAVRKSHEVADVATKRDLEDVRKEINARFDKVDVRFEKTDAEIADVRKDLSAEIADVRKDIEHRFEKVDLQIADIRKDISIMSKDLLFKLGGLMVTLFSIGVAIFKFL